MAGYMISEPLRRTSEKYAVLFVGDNRVQNLKTHSSHA
jgi:hypothetical protein